MVFEQWTMLLVSVPLRRTQPSFVCACFLGGTVIHLGVAQNYTAGVARVLVIVSIHQAAFLTQPFRPMRKTQL